MFKFFRKVPKTPAEVKLEQIQAILFPPFRKEASVHPDTKEEITFLVDYSADSNLQSAIYDLEEGNNDEIVRGTLNKVIVRLIEVRKVLEAYNEFDTDVKYIVVDDLPANRKEIEVGRES